MGKIRIKTLGDEEQEKKDSKKTERKAEAKKAAEAAKRAAGEITDNAKEPKETVSKKTEINEEKKVENPEQSRRTKKDKFKKSKKSSRSKSYLTVVAKVDKSKFYKLADALTLLPELKISKFDETVELHINTIEAGIGGSVTLPHGTGKTTKVEIVNVAEDPKHVDEVIKSVEGGKIDFDILVATPDTMPKLAKIARFLGPKGLMPNPKNGTVTPKPEEVAKKFEGGQMNFKTEAKAPILHLTIGKVSFGDKKLSDNVKAAIEAVNSKKIKSATLKSTMSPGIKLDIASI